MINSFRYAFLQITKILADDFVIMDLTQYYNDSKSII